MGEALPAPEGLAGERGVMTLFILFLATICGAMFIASFAEWRYHRKQVRRDLLAGQSVTGPFRANRWR